MRITRVRFRLCARLKKKEVISTLIQFFFFITTVVCSSYCSLKDFWLNESKKMDSDFSVITLLGENFYQKLFVPNEILCTT